MRELTIGSRCTTAAGSSSGVFSHDVYHCDELNEALGRAGPPQIDLWG